MLEAALDGLPSGVAAWEARRALADLGLADRLEQTASTLSRGEPSRLRQAGLLVQDHDLLLLLDEPTSHLDIDTTDQRPSGSACCGASAHAHAPR